MSDKRHFLVEYETSEGVQTVEVDATDGPFIGPGYELYFRGPSAMFHGEKWVSCVEVGDDLARQ